MALEAMERPSGSRGASTVDPNKPKVGANWTPAEEQQLRDAFNAQKLIADIATAHGRTTGAITARLVKLGLIQDNPLNRSGQGNRPAIRPNRRPDPQSEGSVQAGPQTPPPEMPAELSQEEKDALPF